jgi:hypothetical protein
MRTTLAAGAKVLVAAKAIARQTRKSICEVVSELTSRALASPGRVGDPQRHTVASHARCTGGRHPGYRQCPARRATGFTHLAEAGVAAQFLPVGGGGPPARRWRGPCRKDLSGRQAPSVASRQLPQRGSSQFSGASSARQAKCGNAVGATRERVGAPGPRRLGDQAAANCLRRERIAAPRPPKPTSMIAQVEGSGTAVMAPLTATRSCAVPPGLTDALVTISPETLAKL